MAGLLAFLGLLFGIGLSAPVVSGSSRFVQEYCDATIPGGNPPAFDFTVNPGVPVGAFNNCAIAGGSLGIQQYGSAAATFSFMGVAIPATPGGFVEGQTITGGASALGPGNSNTYVAEPGWPPNSGVDTVRYFRFRTEMPTSPFQGTGGGFSMVWNCTGNYAPGCGPGPTIWAKQIAVTQVDPNPPRLTVGGSIFSPEILRGHKELVASAEDVGGGLTKVEVLVNGLPAGAPALGTCSLYQVKNSSHDGVVSASASPCSPKLAQTWNLDTGTYPFQDGTNSIQICASDLSTLNDPNRTCSGPSPIIVNNSCTESPVPGGEILSVSFARTHKDAVTVPYRKPAKVAGALANNAGDPISGATICVQARTQGSRTGMKPMGTATTDAQGHFTYQVAPGPNRTVLVGYRHDAFQVARSIRYYAHVRPTIKITPGRVGFGGEIKIRGRLPVARSAGRVVILQAASLHSNVWNTFDRATTNKRGIYHSSYVFDATRSDTTYRIRAEVPRQSRLPWESGHSRPALVEVRG